MAQPIKPTPPSVPNSARKANNIVLNEKPSSARSTAPQSPRNSKAAEGPRPPPQQRPGQLNTPITPAAALKLYDYCLTDYEQSEIFNFPSVYFLGSTAHKIKGCVSNPTQNSGYDDDRGDYLIVPHDHICYRYEVLTLLGKGSFGQVCKVYDYKLNTAVAVKIIRNKKRFHHQALVEVKILETLRDHDPDDNYNVIRMQDYFYFRNHLCITFELLSINLFEFIKNNNYQGLSLGLIRRFAIQMLTSLKYLARERVIHCDLKPENILLKSPTKSGIKIIDFGSSCFDDERVYSYIQSRFYRSPEIILEGQLTYGRAIDMWSFACILAELYTGVPLFAGENEDEQLACIMEILDIPPPHILDHSSRRKHFFESSGEPQNKTIVNSRGKKRKPGTKDLVSVLNCSDAAFVSFLRGFLKWDPKERFTADDGLRHEWIMEVMVPFRPTLPMGQVYIDTSRARKRNTGTNQIIAARNTDESTTKETEQAPQTARVGGEKNKDIEIGKPLTARSSTQSLHMASSLPVLSMKKKEDTLVVLPPK